jgi:sugar/nucleoside kinase (ribokinase family)
MPILRIGGRSPYRQVVGVGGIGTGTLFALEGDHTLGRNESRPGQLLDAKDYCKLHIVSHYIAKLLVGNCLPGRFRVLPIGKVGDDAPGRSLLSEMTEAGIDTRFVKIDLTKPTLCSVCFQYADGTGGNITSSNSAASTLSVQDLDDATKLLATEGKCTIALALPEAPLEVRQQFLRIATREGAFRAASFVPSEIAAARTSGMFELLDLVALNWCEAEELLGGSFSQQEPRRFIERCLSLITNSYPNLRMIVSAGKKGAYGFEGNHWNHCPAPEVQVCSTAGAGDSLLAGVIAALASGTEFLRASGDHGQAGRHLGTALELGVLVASYAVTSPHTIHPNASLENLVEFADKLGKTMDIPLFEQVQVDNS